jgi:hypothetical protein
MLVNRSCVNLRPRIGRYHARRSFGGLKERLPAGLTLDAHSLFILERDTGISDMRSVRHSKSQVAREIIGLRVYVRIWSVTWQISHPFDCAHASSRLWLPVKHHQFTCMSAGCPATEHKRGGMASPHIRVALTLPIAKMIQ